jgi:hypothetical protein
MSKTSKNIIGENFSPDLIKQIDTRQKKLGKLQPDTEDIVYNTSKTSWLRLASGVDFNSYTNSDIAKKFNITTSNTNSVAKQFVLFGGVTGEKGPQPLADLATSNLNLKEQIEAQYGIGNHTLWGYDPPPGITSLEIRALNRGAIRKAELIITAHNPDQFQLIETLFLRLGFTMLVEWGHTMYYDNDGNLQNMDYKTSPFTNFLNKFGGGYGRLNTFNETITKEREKYNYNYDAFVGFVSNFTWSIGADGVYNINLTIISPGSLIESLTISKSTDKSDQLEDKENAGNIVSAYFNHWKKVLDDGKNDVINSLSDSGKPTFNRAGEAADNVFKFKFKNKELIKINMTTPDSTEESSPESFSHYYISLGALLRFIEKAGLYYDKKDNPIIGIDSRYGKSFMLSHPYQQSVNPSICILKSSLPDYKGFVTEDPPEKIDGTNTNKPTITSNEQTAAIVGQAIAGLDNVQELSINPFIERFRTTNSKFSGYQADIMGIMVNFDLIINVATSNLDVSLYDFIENILNSISSVTGGINDFSVSYNEDTRKVTIYDNRTVPGVSPERPKIGKFHIYGFKQDQQQGSFIKNFSFQTKVFPQLTNLVAISAHTGEIPLPDEASSFQILNKNLSDRIMGQNEIVPRGSKEKLSTISKYYDEIINLNNHFKIMYTGQRKTRDDYYAARYKALLGNILKYDIQSKALATELVSPFFIPVDLSLTMDGLSGMTLWQQFDITPDYILPPEYPSNLNFIIQGISSTVKDNEWTTTLNTLTWPSNNKKTYTGPTEFFKGTTTFSPPPPGESDGDNSFPLNNSNNSPYFIQSSETAFENFGVELGTALVIDDILKFLHPQARPYFDTFLTELLKLDSLRGYTIALTSSTRSFPQQANEYRKNKKNAPPGRSNHNYGTGIDIGINKGDTVILTKGSSIEKWLDSGIPYIRSKAREAGAFAAPYVNVWGGEFNDYHDPVHFAISFDDNRAYNDAKTLATKLGKPIETLSVDEIFNNIVLYTKSGNIL